MLLLANGFIVSEITAFALAYFYNKTVVKRFEQTRYENPWEKYQKKNITWNFSVTGNGIGLIGTF